MTFHQPVTASRRLGLSCFCAALMIYWVINLTFRWTDSSLMLSNDQVSADQLDFRGTINGVKALPSIPNVLCLGSSLSLVAHWKSDLGLGIRTPDPNHYHYAFSLRKALESLGFRNPMTYDLAVGGALISDSYLLLANYLMEHPAPQFVILDCAPRSFYDSRVTNPCTTVPFRVLNKLNLVANHHHHFLPTAADKFDYLVSQLSYLYAQRDWAKNTISQRFGACIASLSPPAEDFPKQAHKTAVESRHKKSLDDYRNRYGGISDASLAAQMKFIPALSQLCKSHGIELIIINMPLTRANRELLPPSFYERFSQQLASQCNDCHISLLDLHSDPSFTDAVFWDSAHLNESGAAILNRAVAQTVCAEARKLSLSYRSR